MCTKLCIHVYIHVCIHVFTAPHTRVYPCWPRDCLIETAIAEETRLEAKLSNDTEIELYKVPAPAPAPAPPPLLQRNFELKKASYDKEVETARAQAELAFQLQTAKVIHSILLIQKRIVPKCQKVPNVPKSTKHKKSPQQEPKFAKV